jgi:hypothetical protein
MVVQDNTPTELFPTELFAEQVVLLDGIPPLFIPNSISQLDTIQILENRYLLPNLRHTHIYLFPGNCVHKTYLNGNRCSNMYTV